MVAYFFTTLPYILHVNGSVNETSQPHLDISFITFEAIIGILTLLMSLIVLIIFYSERLHFNEVRHYYVISLTFSDFLFVLIGIPVSVGVSIGWPANRIGCLAELGVLLSAGIISVFSIVMASVDKFWAVSYPFHYLNNATMRVTKIIISATWILGLLMGFLPAFGWNRLKKSSFEKCYYMEIIPKSYMIFLLGGIIVPSCLILIYVYTAIYHIYRKALLAPGTSILPSGSFKAREIPTERTRLFSSTDSFGDPNPDFEANKKRGVGCLLFITVFSFILRWLPLYMIDVLYATVPKFKVNEHLKHFLITLRHLNALIVPYLYAYHLVGFKDALVKRFSRIRRWKRVKLLSKVISPERSRE